MMCGSCANENAFKMMYFKYMDDLRGGRDFTQEEMDSCMINQAPGTPQASTYLLHLQMTIQLPFLFAEKWRQFSKFNICAFFFSCPC